MIKNWASQVMIPKIRKPKELLNPTILAFDMEDYGELKVREQKGKKSVTYRKRKPLAVTLAYEDENERMHIWGERMKDRKWSLFELTKWVLDCLWELKVKPTNDTIYLISHFAVAEFRHISDWERYEKDSPFIGKGDFMHWRADVQVGLKKYKLRIIDSMAYFMRGLDKIAKMVGEKKLKIEADGKDHEYWISHMDELLEKHPDKFWEYAEHDSVVLVKAWRIWRRFFLDIFDQEILNDWTPTIASVAASLFRSDYLEDPVLPYKIEWEPAQKRYGDKWEVTQRKVIEFVANPELGCIYDLRLMAVRSYWGGRREAFGRGLLKEPLTILDFKGHYNRCGQTQPLPMASTKWDWFWKNDDLPKILKREGYVEVEFKFPDGFKYPCLPVMSHGGKKTSSLPPRLMFPLQTKNFGEKNPQPAYFTIFELRIAFRICPELKVIIHRAVGFLPTKTEINNPLRTFLKELEQLKNKAQKEKGKSSIEYHATKLMGNAMVGKFFQRVEDWKFEDTLELYASLGYDMTKTSSVLMKEKKRRRKGQGVSKTVGSTWAPEWGSLILGRARGLLGLGFYMVDAISGHTDSMVMKYDETKIDRVIEAMKEYDAILEVEIDTETEERMIFDAFWIMRAAVYVFYKNGEAIKSVHHGYSCKHEEWGELITENLKVAKAVRSAVQKWGIIKPKAAFQKNLPLGADYLKETNVDWKWDFKRQIPKYLTNMKKHETSWLWTKYFETLPWKSVEDAIQKEIKRINKVRGIKKKKKGRPKLKKKQGKIIWELYLEGKSERKIAVITGIPKSSVHDEITRRKKRMKQKTLQDQEDLIVERRKNNW